MLTYSCERSEGLALSCGATLASARDGESGPCGGRGPDLGTGRLTTELGFSDESSERFDAARRCGSRSLERVVRPHSQHGPIRGEDGVQVVPGEFSFQKM